MNFDLNLPIDGEEEQDNINPNEIQSYDVNKVLQANIICLKKKRKFQAEHEGLPLLKHKCLDHSVNYNSDSPFDDTPIKNKFEIHLVERKSDTNDELDSESVRDSNNIDVDNMEYSSTSVSDEANKNFNISTSNFDKTATLSSFNNNPYSLESGSKSSSNNGGNHDKCNNDFGLMACVNYESLLEFGCDVDYGDNVENEKCGTEQLKEKEIEEMLFTNGLSPNYHISSGKWSLNQENGGITKKLTIDKEFEEYFSMLML